MKIVKTNIIFEFPETIELGSTKIVCDKPYQILRTEKDGEVIWWGYNTNWKRINNEWFYLVGGEWVPCDEPEYETKYREY